MNHLWNCFNLQLSVQISLAKLVIIDIFFEHISGNRIQDYMHRYHSSFYRPGNSGLILVWLKS